MRLKKYLLLNINTKDLIMEDKQFNEEYNKYVEKISPKTKPFPSLLWAFVVGGTICCIGEGIADLIKFVFPVLDKQTISAYESIVLIFLASFLTGVGLYDQIGHYAGAGSIIPITGYSNSVTSPAVEFKREGIIFGICVKMFTIAGPVIVTGIVASVIVGIIYLFI